MKFLIITAAIALFGLSAANAGVVCTKVGNVVMCNRY